MKKLICIKCSEPVEPDFDVCWKCGSSYKEIDGWSLNNKDNLDVQIDKLQYLRKQLNIADSYFTPKHKDINQTKTLCIDCNIDNVSSALYCKSCGKDLFSDKVVLYYVCEKCNAEYDDSYEFCIHDGGKVVQKQQHLNHINKDIGSGNKKFNIYKNEFGDTEVVKDGFSWPAFFFPLVWCIYKGLYAWAIYLFIIPIR